MRSQGVPVRSLDITGGALAWDMTGGGAQRAGADARQGRRREEDGRSDDGRAVSLARFRAAGGAPAYEAAPPTADESDGGGVDLRA
jgi:hypothetical protein